MDGIGNFNPYASAAGGAEEIKKILKKEEKKGAKASNILKSIKLFHLAHQKVKEEIAESLSLELGKEVKPNSKLVDEAIFGLSLNRIFEKDESGEDTLAPDLKKALQQFDSESAEARNAVSTKLSQGSQGKVPTNHALVDMDLDEISWRTTQNPDILMS